VQDEVNQDYSEQNEVDGMKKGAGSPIGPMWRIRGRPPSWICDASSNRLFMVSTVSYVIFTFIGLLIAVRSLT